MRFMMLYRSATADSGAPPSEEEMSAMAGLIEEMSAAGVLITTDGLQPSSKGARVRSDGGTITVTDGPFTEAKELIAGYAIVQVDSREEAIGWAKHFLKVAGDGESEVRQMHEPDDFASAEAVDRIAGVGE